MVKILGTINMGRDSVYNGKRIADMTDEEKADVVKQMSHYAGQCVIDGYNDGREGQESQDSHQFSECAQLSDVGCQVNNTNIRIGLGDPDYWTRLEHQYAGMAMQGMLSGSYYQGLSHDRVVEDAQYIAHALVKKLKEESK